MNFKHAQEAITARKEETLWSQANTLAPSCSAFSCTSLDTDGTVCTSFVVIFTYPSEICFKHTNPPDQDESKAALSSPLDKNV